MFVQAGGEPLAGAQIRVATARVRTGTTGQATILADTGRQPIEISRLGYRPWRDTLRLAPGMDTTIRVSLEPLGETLEPVVIATTRAERRVEDEPVRVEVVDRDEVDEKAVMTPGDVAMLLNETSGVRVQMTSPALGGANVRVLGRYVREQRLLTLEEAVRKMTSLPAAIFVLPDRGELKEGHAVELVFFDPQTVGDTNSYEQPKSYAKVVSSVVVNGVVVVDKGEHTGARPGKVILGHGYTAAAATHTTR